MKPQICVVIPIIDEFEMTRKCIKSFEDNATYDLNFLIIDNGSTKKFTSKKKNVHVVRHTKNIGLLESLQEGYELVKKNKYGDIIFYTHNDVFIHESGWDLRVIDVFENYERPGVVGFGSAQGIGAPGIYQTPYEKVQLARQHFMSNMINAEDHGWRRTGVEEVAVHDGFSLIMSVDFLDTVGGFDMNYPMHHMYDNDICLEAIKNSYKNYFVGVSCEHLGGMTSTRPKYMESAKKHIKDKYGEDVENGDASVHDKAHEYFYEKWRGFLPYWSNR